MNKATVIEHFGNASSTADALNITRQAVSQWGDIIPEGMAYKVQAITGGDLSVDPAMYPKRTRAATGDPATPTSDAA
jgi:DNA-binding transcriptional regulator YdaS (Cro superfamily)